MCKNNRFLSNKFKILLVLYCFFISFSNYVNANENVTNENVTNENVISEKHLIVQRVLRQTNEEFFSPQHLCLDLLKNYPYTIPTIAEWLHLEWFPYYMSGTRERYTQSLMNRLNHDEFPIAFVLIKEGMPIGTVSLKKPSALEFGNNSEDSVYLYNLYVRADQRNRGIGQELLKFTLTLAQELGYKNVLLETVPSRVDWYLKRGASIIGESHDMQSFNLKFSLNRQDE